MRGEGRGERGVLPLVRVLRVLRVLSAIDAAINQVDFLFASRKVHEVRKVSIFPKSLRTRANESASVLRVCISGKMPLLLGARVD